MQMHAPLGLPALSVAARVPRPAHASAHRPRPRRQRQVSTGTSPAGQPRRSAYVRCYSSAGTNNPPSGNGHDDGGRPLANSTSARDPLPEVTDSNNESGQGQEADADRPPGFESASTRNGLRSAGVLRSRLARRRAASVLPPVQLPKSFLTDNVSLYSPGCQPRAPLPLIIDAKSSPKCSGWSPSATNDRRPISKQHSPSKQHGQGSHAVVSYFEDAFDILLARASRLSKQFESLYPPGTSLHYGHQSGLVARLVRLSDMLLDSAWHIADALYPARQPLYTYKVRPFWWWHLPSCMASQSGELLEEDLDMLERLDRRQQRLLNFAPLFDFAELSDNGLPHDIADFPIETFSGIRDTVARDLAAPAPSSFDSKTSKRPISIVSMTGFGGSSISQAIAQHVGVSCSADVVYLDAHDLGALVGDYLGQNLAFSRGSLSMLGYRAAELSGRVEQDPEVPARHSDDEDDGETSILSLRSAAGTLEDELAKIRSGASDVFSKWENLKIDKILDQIIRTPATGAGFAKQRPVLIHLHDYVELSMTLEGSVLIARLRNLVDLAWQQGAKIALIGTSSSERPSEEYQSMIRELAAGDLVVPRHIQPDGPHHKGDTPNNRRAFSLQRADTFVENARNIQRMVKAINPSFPTFEITSKLATASLTSSDPKETILCDSVMPAPEVYHIASMFQSTERFAIGGSLAYHPFAQQYSHSRVTHSLGERLRLGPLRLKPGQSLHEHDANSATMPSGNPSSAEKSKSASLDSTTNLKLNDYEKRISTGQIKRENLRTTFDDVHAPTETKAALKLLTSLALLRPDAFSYGVLKADKIPGCLLYGPPGTGKTMLAKAVAKESGANMLEISGANINDKWVGESEKLIRAVFTLAKKLSPCVVFIDEADSLLASRSMFSGRPSHREHINQFLKEWDGLEETDAFIMVATNRPFDLDDAVLRRLPRKLLVDLPRENDRAAILRLLLRGEELDAGVVLGSADSSPSSPDSLAARTPFYSGSDLKNVCVAAAMAAVEEENTTAMSHDGPEPYTYPEKRILRPDHFERALKQIPASISEDMPSLKLIRRFDEDYGDGRKSKRKARGMGFGVLEKELEKARENEATIRR